MPVLTSDLRRQLENIIVDARQKAEAAARSALRKLGIEAAKAHEHFGAAQKTLRNQLRARGRQAGDQRQPDGTQEIEQLTGELAYEYWHRMLFARFLAENGLLMHPDGVAVSLKDCDELAPAQGVPNGFVLAARYASRMLPQIFRTDDVLLTVEFPANDRIPLEKLLASLPSQTFTADDSLGWVYQFWQSKRKDEVNARGDKIDARSISAVTQLFTEHYMVLFLLHNTVGAWHAGKALAANPHLAQSAASEEELRKAAALKSGGGYNFEYLRFVRSEGSAWRPAAGTFDGWPKHARELKTLDPCCGSGHFLVALFELLVRLRMEEEGLSTADATDAVLRDNIHGLELDPRCTQIAAFNLAMAAWKLAGYRPLPPLNIACTGRAPVASADDWLEAVASKLAALPLRDRDPVKLGIRHLHDLFTDGPTLGSLIDVGSSQGLGAADWSDIEPFVDAAMKLEGDDYEMVAEGVTAQGLAAAARILAGPQPADPGAADVSGVGYHLVITNVPYLGRGKQDSILQKWCEKNEPDAKADLATAFISRSFKWLAKGGSVAIVSPQNWLFLTTYKKLRERLLRDEQWNIVARLGPNAFQDMNWWAATTTLLTWTRQIATNDHVMLGIDVSADKRQVVKAALLSGKSDELITTPAVLHQLPQARQKNNPDSRIVIGDESVGPLLSEYASAFIGMHVGDNERFVTCFWEHARLSDEIRPYQVGVLETALYGGKCYVMHWPDDGRLHFSNPAARVQGIPAWRKRAVAVRLMGKLPVCVADGDLFEQTIANVLPNNPEHLPAVWTYLTSEDYRTAVRAIDQKVNVTNGTLSKVPFDLAHWQSAAAEKYPNGLPEPESDDPTQWLFHGRPEASAQPLQVAVARLAGYRWPAELDAAMRLSERARGLAKRCDELLPFVDEDGILPISAMRGEKPLHERVTELLAAAYVPPALTTWSPSTLHKLLTDAGANSNMSLDDWLRASFFEQHCKIFHQRPFIWHIWDGRKDGFNVLVNYHSLDQKRLESLTHAYLGDWISTQRSDARSGVTGADLRVKAAEDLQAKLEKILEGEKPYDVFVRWKPLKDQPIGWNPDLNDGVRMNIRPFVEAGILRKTPNIKWTKDRGKDPQTAPWYAKFGGERINDYHLSLAEKRAARGET
jgi:hypothetical protein